MILAKNKENLCKWVDPWKKRKDLRKIRILSEAIKILAKNLEKEEESLQNGGSLQEKRNP